MNSTELLATFREETTDNVAPYFWSDALIYRYLNDAQEMFCRLTEGIEDSSIADICRLNIVAGTDWYPLSKKILKVRGVVNSTSGRPYELLSAEIAAKMGVMFNGAPGPARRLVQGLEKGKLRAWPMPNENDTVEIRVFRLPLTKIDGDDQDLEVDEQHHLALLLWAKHRAYGVEDADVFDRRKSNEYEEKFRAYCAAAKTEQGRARHDAGNVMYGGI